MTHDEKYKNRYRIESARAIWHDYNDGFYFITICTQNREYFFGNIKNGKMILFKIGEYAEKCIKMMETLHNGVSVSSFQIMPNHIHFIITIEKPRTEMVRAETPYYDVTEERTMQKIANDCGRLSHIISRFKSSVTKFANEHNIAFAWQSRFHDHIIRNQKEMDLITEYIENNVARWEEDCFYIHV